jgi:hypothetical protein
VKEKKQTGSAYAQNSNGKGEAVGRKKKYKKIQEYGA